ncbi:hypothetical protein G7081_00365 [Vagococcus coleopterorum]|uniref:CDP-glycerol glycerophosphotransferase, TagB/SpsB family n=1 Tax=Vagococcus coleopterorum TaxID=2714946 RepID=A0A6G8AKW7_9ENTE|nr:CDP-glycerol glycerophosphotransferase family protein [Vagococcus coleopterorum]QIL45646.1 hypothetical protein G7081_00365 [Vagococcus coleopterorum]
MSAKTTISSLLKKSYISFVKLLSAPNDYSPTKIVYFMSFQNNDGGLIRALGESYGKENILICYKKNCQSEANQFSAAGYAIRSLEPSINFFRKTLKEITSAKWIICDNYFPILGGLNLSDETNVIQIWHAVGAVKKFGWDDPATLLRSKGDQERFSEVYKRFDYYVVSSDRMAEVFKASYHATESQMLKFGFPRADELLKNRVNHTGEVNESDQILYAPTYRENNKVIIDTLQTLNEYARYSEEKVTYILHPVTKSELSELKSYDNLIEVSVNDSAYQDIYKQVSYLISDYSSVIFDYALLNPKGKIQFYWPDFDSYNQKTGIQESFKERYMAGAAKTTADLLEALSKKDTIDLDQLNNEWNQYNDGQAITRLVEFIK